MGGLSVETGRGQRGMDPSSSSPTPDMTTTGVGPTVGTPPTLCLTARGPVPPVSVPSSVSPTADPPHMPVVSGPTISTEAPSTRGGRSGRPRHPLDSYLSVFLTKTRNQVFYHITHSPEKGSSPPSPWVRSTRVQNGYTKSTSRPRTLPRYPSLSTPPTSLTPSRSRANLKNTEGSVTPHPLFSQVPLSTGSE